MKAADAMHLDQRIEGEDELGPATPLSRPQRKFLPADADLHRIAIVRDRKSHRNEDVRGISEQLVRRALNLCGDDALVILELHDIDRELIRRTGAVKVELRGEVERLADAARQIGDAEAGEQLAGREIVRR